MVLRAVSRWRVAPKSGQGVLKRTVPVARKHLSTKSQATDDPTLFTAEIPKRLIQDEAALIKTFRDACQKKNIIGSGGKGHDAAVVLATPGLTRLLDNGDSIGRWADLLSPHGQGGHFNLVSAIVDHVPSASRPSLADGEGISILRGPSDSILPQPWNSTPSRQRKDQDAVGALICGINNVSSVTLPLARTIFQNSKPSTLVTSRFDVSSGSPQLAESKETFEQHVNIPLQSLPTAVKKTPQLWLPLRALTQPRMVTESFGNILRRLQIDGRSSPASSELEASVDEIYKKIQEKLPEGVEVPLMGVWAVVNPTPGESRDVRDWNIENLEDVDSKKDLIQALRTGGRPFKLLSGGGGWGSKAGLLSFDPETSHFAATEEEELQMLFGNSGQSDFVPVGSEVQFFCSDIWSQEAQLEKSGGETLHRLVFGVFEDASNLCPETGATDDIIITPGHFGAVSNSAIYVSGGNVSPFKLSVPGAQLGIP